MHKYRSLFAVIILIAAILACATPLGGAEPAQPANVETVVAATLQALTASAQEPVATVPPVASGLLPHSFYFLNNDAAGLAQVYRLEKDGKTVTQVTLEPAKVDSYDVSRLDGSVVYVSNNQMLLVNTDGSNRRLLLDGGSVDENNPYLNNISFPVFSPDNQTIAFGHGGLSFYSVATGQSNLVLKNVFDEYSGGLIPKELHWPESYSADGTKLVITIGHYEGATAAIYYPNGGALVRLNGGNGALICCGDTEWAGDGSAFFAANPTVGMSSAGLWRVDAATGNVTTLFTDYPETDPVNLADEPFPAPDGQLYFFFASIPIAALNDFSERTPLQLVRSAADGVTNRTVLRPETYKFLNETLWAPDASFVIAAVAPIHEIYQGGEARLVYTDGQKSIISLVPFAMNMKWGP